MHPAHAFTLRPHLAAGGAGARLAWRCSAGAQRGSAAIGIGRHRFAPHGVKAMNAAG